jgi:hypothetical protein
LKREEYSPRNSFFVFQEPSSHLNPLVQLGIQLREGSLAKAPDEESLLRDLWDGGGGDSIEIEKAPVNVYPKPYRPSGGEKQRMFLVMALKKIDIAMQTGTPTWRAASCLTSRPGVWITLSRLFSRPLAQALQPATVHDAVDHARLLHGQ